LGGIWLWIRRRGMGRLLLMFGLGGGVGDDVVLLGVEFLA
jgi:hypothetical protein